MPATAATRPFHHVQSIESWESVGLDAVLSEAKPIRDSQGRSRVFRRLTSLGRSGRGGAEWHRSSSELAVLATPPLLFGDSSTPVVSRRT